MEMKEKIQKAILAAITVAIGITLVTLVMGESFSLFNTWQIFKIRYNYGC